MRTTSFALVVAGILLANVARGDLEVGSFAPDVEAKEWINAEGTLPKEKVPSLAELRGMVIVLFFWVSFHSGGESVMPIINIVENNPSFGRSQGVTVIGLTDAARRTVEETIKNEKVFFPVGVESEARKDYEITSFPRVVIVDPDGKVAWSGWPGQANDMIKAIRDIVAKNPPRMTHPEEAERCRADLDEAREAIRRKDWRRAFKASRAAYERAVSGDPLKTACQDMLDLVEALGRDQMGRVDQLLDDKKYELAVAILRHVRRAFRGLDVSQKAKQRLQELKEKYERVAELLQEQQDDVAAGKLYLQAREWIQKRRFGKAFVQLETIIEDHGETEAAEYAERLLARMEQNPAVMARVRDYKAARDCQTWLSQGSAYEAAGRTERAKQLYRQVIQKYPNTKYAREAQRKLINMR